MESTGLVLRCQCVHHPSIPLTTCLIPDIFKIYSLDTGLLGALSGLDPRIILREPSPENTFRGPMAENFVAQHLRAYSHQPLAYWRRKNNIGEIDFLLEANSVIPVEVKSGTNPKSKSLCSYIMSYQPDFAYRLSLLNFRSEKSIRNIPLYAVHLITRATEF
ncbi:DUF4143 domain-containing protein [bacterium]|nr:DUF4143 domain-containing protein [bacterium]